MKLCIVDDSSFQRNQLRKLLERLGHEVSAACSGEEAQQLLQKQSFDGIITDLLMPGIGGIELSRAVRVQYPVLPIVVLTADIQETVRNECLSLGVCAFINKPFTEEKIASALGAMKKGQAA